MAKHKVRRITGAGKLHLRGGEYATTLHVDGKDKAFAITQAAAWVLLNALRDAFEAPLRERFEGSPRVIAIVGGKRRG